MEAKRLLLMSCINEETIGGIGNLPRWTPGTGNTSDKGELADEGIMDKGVKDSTVKIFF